MFTILSQTGRIFVASNVKRGLLSGRMTEDRIKHALTNNLKSWDISSSTPMGTKIGQFLKLFPLKCKGLSNISASSILLQSHPKFE